MIVKENMDLFKLQVVHKLSFGFPNLLLLKFEEPVRQEDLYPSFKAFGEGYIL